MIVLFTDFGLEGPYIGQVKAVLHRLAPGVAVIDLFADAPAHDPRAAAYLLAAYAGEFPAEAVFLCVVDPGVGSERTPVVAKADGRHFVGPGNGLFEIALRRAQAHALARIDWRPERLSASFHGRDLFAPVAAALACGRPVATTPLAFDGPRPGADWPDELDAVIYVDRFGNAMTGRRAASLGPKASVAVHGRTLTRARTFADVKPGAAFWYENANGLVEIAVNRGRADRLLGLSVGSAIAVKS